MKILQNYEQLGEVNQRNYFLLLITQSQRASNEITSFQANEKISSHGV